MDTTIQPEPLPKVVQIILFILFIVAGVLSVIYGILVYAYATIFRNRQMLDQLDDVWENDGIV